MLLQEKLNELKSQKKAILAANFYNYETLAGILKAASGMNLPVILQLSQSSLEYLGVAVAANMGKTALKEFGVQGWLHLDHGGSVNLVRKCLDAGFDSVMIDASEKPFDENMRTTMEVMKLAQSYKANVEAELGYVAKLGQEQDTGSFTSPEDARRFAEGTGVNCLAVAIGSAHGFYKKEPRLDMERLAAIATITPCPLVLHGSSGIPDAMLQKAIRNGITKVNLATETKNAFMKRLQEILAGNTEIDLRKVFPVAIDAVENLITSKLKVINNA